MMKPLPLELNQLQSAGSVWSLKEPSTKLNYQAMMMLWNKQLKNKEKKWKKKLKKKWKTNHPPTVPTLILVPVLLTLNQNHHHPLHRLLMVQVQVQVPAIVPALVQAIVQALVQALVQVLPEPILIQLTLDLQTWISTKRIMLKSKKELEKLLQIREQPMKI